MIICHKHRFIFIKTAKTASTSIEIALSKFCDSGDIVTPLIKADEALRHSLNYQSPVNYHLNLFQYKLRDIKQLMRTKSLVKFGHHCSAKYVKSRLSPMIWGSYYKFCFDRNPWDKAISLYYWQTRNQKKRMTFDVYFKNLKKQKLSNYNKYTLNDKLLVNDVFKFENLKDSLQIISDKLNISIYDYLPKTKDNIRTNRQHYTELLSESQIDFIKQICQKEIKLLNY